LPIPPSPPDFSDEGPHLAYAVQWFSFAVIGLVGYVLLLGRARRSRS
jgi:surfeit locus 1 family protein